MYKITATNNNGKFYASVRYRRNGEAVPMWCGNKNHASIIVAESKEEANMTLLAFEGYVMSGKITPMGTIKIEEETE